MIRIFVYGCIGFICGAIIGILLVPVIAPQWLAHSGLGDLIIGGISIATSAIGVLLAKKLNPEGNFYLSYSLPQVDSDMALGCSIALSSVTGYVLVSIGLALVDGFLPKSGGLPPLLKFIFEPVALGSVIPNLLIFEFFSYIAIRRAARTGRLRVENLSGQVSGYATMGTLVLVCMLRPIIYFQTILWDPAPVLLVLAIEMMPLFEMIRFHVLLSQNRVRKSLHGI